MKAFKNMKREKKTNMMVWAGRDVLPVFKIKPNAFNPLSSTLYSDCEQNVPKAMMDETLYDKPNSAAPALGGFNGPQSGFQVDFTNFGAPGSEANNPGLKLMLNVEEALRMYVAQTVNGVHKTTFSPFAPIPPGLVNAAREAKIAASEFSKMPFEFSVVDFLNWQNRQVTTKKALLMKNGLFASEYAFVGDAHDVSTWFLPVATPKQVRRSLNMVMETREIPKKERLSLKAELEARDVKQGERKSLAKKGKALPDGSFPIANKNDLSNAKQAIGRAKNHSESKEVHKQESQAIGRFSYWCSQGSSRCTTTPERSGVQC